MKDLIVYKSNDLVSASYNLTLAEQRIVLFAISKLNPTDLNDNKTVTIKVGEFAEQYKDINKNSVYKAIKDGLDDLYNKSIIIKDSSKKITFRWLQSKTYYNNEASAEIVFSDQIMPYLFDLKNKFTKYKLSNISSFKSSYSVRLYELLAQYKVVKTRNIEVNILREILLLNNKYIRLFDFKKRVVEKAVKEINNKSDLFISYKISSNVISFSIKNKVESEPLPATPATGTAVGNKNRITKSTQQKKQIKKTTNFNANIQL